jgi:hypothetical protein
MNKREEQATRFSGGQSFTCLACDRHRDGMPTIPRSQDGRIAYLFFCGCDPAALDKRFDLLLSFDWVRRELGVGA